MLAVLVAITRCRSASPRSAECSALRVRSSLTDELLDSSVGGARRPWRYGWCSMLRGSHRRHGRGLVGIPCGSTVITRSASSLGLVLPAGVRPSAPSAGAVDVHRAGRGAPGLHPRGDRGLGTVVRERLDDGAADAHL